MQLSVLDPERDFRDLLFDSAPEPYIVTDSGGGIELWNRAAIALLGPLTNTRFLPSLVALADRPRLRRLLIRALPGDRLAFEGELELSEKKIAVELIGSAQLTGSDEQRTFWVIRDITEQKRATERQRDENEELERRVSRRTHELEKTLHELETANAAKDNFLGLVSHELRTPMTVILGNAKVLSNCEFELPTDAREQAIKDIAAEAERLHRLLENLMILARLDSTEDFEPEPVLLQHLIHVVINEFSARRPDRLVLCDLPETLPLVAGNSVYLEQVVENLLTNADKYSPRESPIEISGEVKGREVRVDIADHGGGIEAEERKAVFSPFYRARNVGKVPGMGIGLAVCSRLIEAQSGHLGVEDRKGGGSVFYFMLPIYVGEPATAGFRRR